MTQTTSQRQFSTAKKFAAHTLRLMGTRHVKTLNDMSGHNRLLWLIRDIERFVRLSQENGVIEQRYNGAILGFQSAFSRCLEPEIYLVINQWDTRKMLETLHTLMIGHEAYSPYEYARALTALVKKEMEGQNV